MELKNGLNKRVVEIYRGGELVWNLPRAGLQVDSLALGLSVIKGLTYPLKSDIKIVIKNSATNKHEEYNFKNSSINWSQAVKPLEEDDEVTITVSSDGWIGTSFDDSIF